MLSLLLYLILLVCIIFSSLTVFILCLVKVVQVSNGFSLLDPEVSTGLRIRKWLLIGIAAANGTRCLSSAIEFIIFSIKVVKDDESTNSISFYSGFHELIPFTVFVSRVLPTLFFFACYGIMALYMSELYYSVRELKFSMVRTFWVAINLLLIVALVQYLMVSSKPRVLSIIGLVATMLYALWISWFSYCLNQFYFHNEESLSGGLSAGQRKVFSRLKYLVCIGLSALVSYAVYYTIDISGLLIGRSYYCQSSLHLAAILYSEVVCDWFIVSLLSNTLVSVESRVASLCVSLSQQLSHLFSVEAGSSSAAAGAAEDSSSPSSAPLLRLSPVGGLGGGTGGSMRTIQQQQHLKNYQSIKLDESLP